MHSFSGSFRQTTVEVQKKEVSKLILTVISILIHALFLYDLVPALCRNTRLTAEQKLFLL